MKFITSAFLTAAFLLPLSQAAAAAPYNCRAELRKLVIPALAPSPMPKNKMQVELADISDDNGHPRNGVYGVQIWIAADSPDNADGKVAIGWVDLDTRNMKIFDVTQDEYHPQELKIDKKLYSNFVKRCLGRDQ